MRAAVHTGHLWDPSAQRWTEGRLERLSVVHDRRLLLIPKVLARTRLDYDRDEYYGDYLIPVLRDEELHSPTRELVVLMKNGTSRVTKKSLIRKYGDSKQTIVRETRKRPDVLKRYRHDKGRAPSPPINHEHMMSITEDIATFPVVDYDVLLNAITSLPVGEEHAPRSTEPSNDYSRHCSIRR